MCFMFSKVPCLIVVLPKPNIQIVDSHCMVTQRRNMRSRYGFLSWISSVSQTQQADHCLRMFFCIIPLFWGLLGQNQLRRWKEGVWVGSRSSPLDFSILSAHFQPNSKTLHNPCKSIPDPSCSPSGVLFAPMFQRANRRNLIASRTNSFRNCENVFFSR